MGRVPRVNDTKWMLMLWTWQEHYRHMCSDCLLLDLGKGCFDSVLDELWGKKWNVMLYYILTSFHLLHRFPCQCYLSRAWCTIVTLASTAKMLSSKCMVQWQFWAWPPATGGTSVHHRHWGRWWSIFYILHCDSLIFLNYFFPCWLIDWSCEAWMSCLPMASHCRHLLSSQGRSCGSFVGRVTIGQVFSKFFPATFLATIVPSLYSLNIWQYLVEVKYF